MRPLPVESVAIWTLDAIWSGILSPSTWPKTIYYSHHQHNHRLTEVSKPLSGSGCSSCNANSWTKYEIPSWMHFPSCYWNTSLFHSYSFPFGKLTSSRANRVETNVNISSLCFYITCLKLNCCCKTLMLLAWWLWRRLLSANQQTSRNKWGLRERIEMILCWCRSIHPIHSNITFINIRVLTNAHHIVSWATDGVSERFWGKISKMYMRL